MSCASLETAAAWVLGEPDEADPGAHERFEEHYFSCDSCLERVERVQRLVALLRQSVPLLLTPERRRWLEALYPRMPKTSVDPGQRATLRLSSRLPVGLWVMRAPLERATRVDFEAHDAQGGTLMTLQDAPFDVARGEVVMPCQWHYRALGGPNAEMRVRLTLTERGGAGPALEYILDHEFESL
jgi:hypothetical protein